MAESVARGVAGQPGVADNGGKVASGQFEDSCRGHHTIVRCTVPCGLRESKMTEQDYSWSLKLALPVLCAGCPLRWSQCLPSCQAVENYAVNAAQAGLKAKSYQGPEEWLVHPNIKVCDVRVAEEPLPPELCRPRRKFIEKC